MFFFKLPPVRRPVPVELHGTGSLAREGLSAFVGRADLYDLRLYSTGTEALAVAIAAAVKSRKIAKPEVILPAYACPDLISACMFAGVFPRLVDTAAGAWGYDIAALQSALTPSTIGVIAVNFLGVGDQSTYLRAFAQTHRLVLIQDSAQYLPDHASTRWVGDYIIFSFGRGKPLNLLGGGALLFRAENNAFLEGYLSSSYVSLLDRFLQSKFGGFAFNVLTHPRLYWLTSKLPGFKVGATTYVPLKECVDMTPQLYERVSSAFHLYAQTYNYDATKWQRVVHSWQKYGFRLLMSSGWQKQDRQYLRLPLLAPSQKVRDLLVEKLNKKGLGASAMYQLSLNHIADIPNIVTEQRPFPNAECLASRLFTLPTHSMVDEAVVANVDQVIIEVMNNFKLLESVN